jgi:hypothetical protein
VVLLLLRVCPQQVERRCDRGQGCNGPCNRDMSFGIEYIGGWDVKKASIIRFPILCNNWKMNIYESVQQWPLEELLNEIDKGDTKLPEFQRSFVWDPEDSQNLLISIANNFPAGSILQLRDVQGAFQIRDFAGAPRTEPPHQYLILDGQQRLTSLYQALYGVGAYRFFLDLEKIKTDNDLSEDDTITYQSIRRQKTLVLERSIEQQVLTKRFPLSVIYGRNGGFWKWVDDAREFVEEESKNEFNADMRNLYSNCIEVIEKYKFPLVTLNKNASTEAICTIFETLNKTGVRLSVFELMTARVWKDDIKLTELWKNACLQHPIFDDYKIDPYYILQAISLSSREHPSCKKKDILSLSSRTIAEHWPKVVESLAYGLQILRQDCKILNRKWLPTPSMLGPLAAMLAISRASGAAVGAHRLQVVRWLWCSIFGERYQAAANTRAERDVLDMKIWFEGGSPPDHVKNFRFDKQILRELYKPGSIYKGVICLTLVNRALDFHTRGEIKEEMVLSGKVDDHHIFPDNYLETHLDIKDEVKRSCVLNRTLINRDTNRSIWASAPSDYLQEIFDHFDHEPILKSHLIPSGVGSPLLINDYEEFLNQRAELVMNEIEKVTR